MRYATKFIDDAQKLQREYYLGKIQRETAIVMMGELMRHHRVIAEDEILVDIPDSFRQTGVYEADCEFLGEFTVRHKDSKWTWKRSFARNMPQRRWKPAPQVFVAPPVLSEEEQKFFASYEKQVAAEIASGGQRRSALFTRFGITRVGDVEL